MLELLNQFLLLSLFVSVVIILLVLDVAHSHYSSHQLVVGTLGVVFKGVAEQLNKVPFTGGLAILLLVNEVDLIELSPHLVGSDGYSACRLRAGKLPLGITRLCIGLTALLRQIIVVKAIVEFAARTLLA